MEFSNRNQLFDQAKFQTPAEIVDVTGWSRGTSYPEGARDKFDVFAPDNAPHSFIIPRHRYMFKHSDKKYPGDFLVEIIAYRIGVRMGIPVVPAFIAIDRDKKLAGALGEWFYSYPSSQIEDFQMGGDILQRVIPGYERKKGTQHNITDILGIFDSQLLPNFVAEREKENFLKILIFDALIGNGDRHQDNWGIISCNGGAFLAPAFDNGSSMGHEILEQKLPSKDIKAYIQKGTHHLKFGRSDEKEAGHFDLLRHLFKWIPKAKEILDECIGFSMSELLTDLSLIKETQDSLPYSDNWLTEARMNFIQSLLIRRHELLKEMLR